MNTIFESVFNETTTLGWQQFIICLVGGLLIGAFFSAAYSFRSRFTKGFMMTLFLLPAMVAAVIIMVNGNVGAGVAVAGAFSLVRFRSVPGTAKEISAIFMAMVAGLICGMGYLGYAALFAITVGVCMLIFQASHLGESKKGEKLLRITIPEDLNYTDIFEEDMNKFTTRHELLGVKTCNMGSLFKISYSICMKDVTKEKEFIDSLRCKNGNLEIAIMTGQEGNYEL
ncbi:MAG: DUF4956 domain-containing protein [Lachnospiraceae bacterium]|nr:DUF4956 domain-containing protein [Lachnospiraceae bacterium]